MTAFDYRAFCAALLYWFERHGRHDLPWQGRDNPYGTWVSEIMLQQTQVTTVIPYFERFMVRFPDLRALAAADIDDVLQHWTGLGYYARARNLHQCAMRLVREHAGRFPRDIDALIDLPGIGRSTAGAILAQSFDERHPILDGNVKRVLARVHRIDGWPGKTSVLRQLWYQSEQHTPRQQVARYTQAIMDLGATVCTRKADCIACPVSGFCAAYRHDDVQRYPGRKPPRSLPTRATLMLLIRDSQRRIYLERRPPTGIWGGLWIPPQFDDEGSMRNWMENIGIRTTPPAKLGASLTHTFSHFRLEITALHCELVSPPAGIQDSDNVHWLLEDEWPGGTARPIERLLDRLRDQLA